ncbi:MAG: hypothetical protein C0617_00580 [Desulfuromonas sp.]|uniref:hypothetical protein n=1 Tax=Desulfuromonas sp. TaxID=892 RepID=UPI000CB2FC35|nr:hypothetical protein [Desulfuromonas sp.]PLX86601.1 MAG: hypothetical protein C0617_00580 [Desulfuromonas sp.]
MAPGHVLVVDAFPYPGSVKTVLFFLDLADFQVTYFRGLEEAVNWISLCREDSTGAHLLVISQASLAEENALLYEQVERVAQTLPVIAVKLPEGEEPHAGPDRFEAVPSVRPCRPDEFLACVKRCFENSSRS